MQGLDRAGRRYVGIVVAAGAAVLAHSVWALAVHPPSPFLAALIALTLMGSAATLRVPGMPVSFSISDTFTIAAALLFGTPGGTLAAGLDGLVCSYRLRNTARTRERMSFNTAAPAVAMWLSSTAFFAIVPTRALMIDPVPPGTLIAPLVLFAALCFVLNTGLVARGVAFERGGRTLAIWREHFMPLGLTYLAAASLAGLLATFVSAGRLDLAVLGLVVPLPALVYLAFKHALGRAQDHLGHLAEINRMYLATIETLAAAIDAKDQVTHGHIRRVQRQSVRLARELGIADDVQIRAIEAASLLHDTGKLAIPDHILNKPGRLTPAEFEIMKRHAPIGAELLSTIDFPYPVVPIVRHHHENWDGTGYPDGLRGEAIPIGARILSVVDCFDALMSDRPYRPRMSSSAALDILRERRGWMYDPRVVDTFIRLSGDLVALEDKEEESASRETRLAAISGSIQALAEQERRTPDADEDTHRLRTALAVGLALASEHGPDGAIRALLDALGPRARVTNAALLRVDGDDTLAAAAVAGPSGAELLRLRMRVGEGVSGWVAANREPMVNADARLDLQGRVALDGDMPQSMLAVPVVARDHSVGVLALYSADASAFTDAELRLLTAIAHAFADRLTAAPAH